MRSCRGRSTPFPPWNVVVIGHLDADHRRFAALTTPDDTTFVDLLSAGDPIGARVRVTSSATNVVVPA